jgi:hypothetical protein
VHSSAPPSFTHRSISLHQSAKKSDGRSSGGRGSTMHETAKYFLGMTNSDARMTGKPDLGG